MIPVIAIDGPTASGKGTVAQAVAQALGWHYLDSGALYRMVALAALRSHVDLNDGDALARLATHLAIRFQAGQIQLDGEDVSRAIRAEETGNAASQIAVHAPLRQALVERQRALRQPPGLVADGRDMGSTIFPDAALKVFLVAAVEARAARRTKQLMENGIFANMSTLLLDLQERDRRDSQRQSSPLAAAPDAIVIDSSSLGAADVVARVLALATERGLAKGRGAG